MTPDAARRWCREFTFRHRENFAVVSRFLGRRLRDEYAVIYAFSRFADDLADSVGGDLENGNCEKGREEGARRRLAALDEWRRRLEKMYRWEQPDHPVFIALQSVVQEKELEKELFVHLLDAFRQDQLKTRYSTWREVRAYSAGSADPVGRLVLRLHGYRSPRLDELSDAICTGLQLANFLQDIREDYLQRDRVYLPLEDMSRFGVVEEMLAEVPSPLPLRELISREVERAERYLHRGRKLIDEVRGSLSRQVILFHGGGRLALDAIRRADYDTATAHCEAGMTSRAALVIRALGGKAI